MKCPSCGGPMIAMIVSSVCKNECDLKPKKLQTQSLSHAEAIELWWSGKEAIECLSPGNEGLALFRVDDTLWTRWDFKEDWTWSDTIEISIHRENLFLWSADTRWRITEKPEL